MCCRRERKVAKRRKKGVPQIRFAHQLNTRLLGASLGLHNLPCPSFQRSFHLPS